MYTQSDIILCVNIRRIIGDAMNCQEMTQVMLSEMTGITQPRISDFLTGRRDIRTDTLVKILKALNLEIRSKTRRKGR